MYPGLPFIWALLVLNHFLYFYIHKMILNNLVIILESLFTRPLSSSSSSERSNEAQVQAS